MKSIRGIVGEKVGHATVTDSKRAVIRGQRQHWTANLNRAAQSRVPGEANKTEAQYGLHLDDLMKAGEVLWWRFHPCRLRVTSTPAEGGGKALYYSPDFIVVYPDRVELHDTKPAGFKAQHAWSNIRAAAEVFPIFGFAIVSKRKKADGGGWKIERL